MEGSKVNKLHVKKGDTVIVLSGKDKGKKGKVLEVSPKERKVIVENVNMVTKHVKPRKMGDQGGIVKAEGAMYALMTTLSSLGICMTEVYPNFFISAGAYSFLYWSFILAMISPPHLKSFTASGSTPTGSTGAATTTWACASS